MKSLLCALVACVVIGAAGTAAANENEGGGASLGVGVAQTFFVSGLSIHASVNDQIGIQGVFNLDVTAPEVGDSVTDISLAVRGHYHLWDLGDSSHASAFAGIDLFIPGQDGLDTLIGISGGLQINWMFVPNMSAYVDVGVGIAVNEPLFSDATPVDATIIDFGVGETMAGAGVTFWW